jgi:hypothetical protein
MLENEEKIESFTDEELRAELQRRVDLISISSQQSIKDAADLSELAPGAQAQETDNRGKGIGHKEWQGSRDASACGNCSVSHLNLLSLITQHAFGSSTAMLVAF